MIASPRPTVDIDPSRSVKDKEGPTEGVDPSLFVTVGQASSVQAPMSKVPLRRRFELIVVVW